MKKIFSLFAAALMSVSLFAGWPATVPTIQDLSDAGYNITSARVIALYFEEEVCNDIVWYGSYNEWATDPTSMLKFETLEGFEGWYVVELNDESETVQGKPVQLKKDGSFSLDFQSGDTDAWENMFQPFTKSATITNGESGEANCTWPNLAAYIYMVHYFKNHNTPCVPAKGDLTATDFEISNNIVTYNGEAKAATVTLKSTISGAGTVTVTYKQNDEVVANPTNAGEYDIYAIVTEGDNYNAFVATKVGTLTINKALPTADNFIYIAPENLTWDGNPKSAIVTFNDQSGKLTGMGNITVEYNGVNALPSAVSKYSVSINVDEGTNYNAGSSIYDDSWNFTIQAVFVPTNYLDENGESHNVDAIPISSTSSPVFLGATNETTWFVVNGADVQLASGICSGDIRLILADGAKLTATYGVNVSKEGSSLTIYGQAEQSGQLIATGDLSSAGIGGGGGNNGTDITINGGKITAIGGKYGAGIGGGDGYYYGGAGSNITINGGIVTATGGMEAAGIGGGCRGIGSNITINGGMVIATGGAGGASIGNGKDATLDASIIKVATNCIVKAGDSANPTDVITNTGADLASSLADKQYATIETKPTPISVDYIDENGAEQTASAYVVADASTQVTLGTIGETSWYVVNGADVQLTNGAVCNGDVRLILADDAKLTATGADSKAGVHVSGEDNSLTIYGQTAQSGQLIATGGEWGAGIGGEDGNYDHSVANGSNITINGGMIEAIGGFKGAGIGAGYRGNGSYITINRGTVVATGGDYGAGIGGGYGYHDSSVGNGSDIIINGGMVTANGGEQAAGIGGGYDGNGSNITINGGTVVANGRAWGAGIGGGHDGDGSNITINGGTVTANGDDGGAGIGGGNDGDGSNITINGGTVIAIGGYKGAGIGAGMDAFGSDIFVATSMLVKAGETENPTDVITNTGADLASSLKGKRYVIIESKPIPVSVAYIDENGAEQTASAYVVADASAQVTLGTVGETSWYVVNGADVQLTKGAVCNGDVRLILADDAKLTATGWYDEEEYDGYAGIQVSGEGNSLSVYGQAAQTGQLIAQGSKDCAGIGSEKGECVYNITINGGNITATGGGSGAGIGSGHKTHCYNITINGGTVEANGGNGAAGIGGGNCGNVSNIVINGGTVTANGGTGCAGIGAGNNGVASDIYVSTIFQVKADGNNPPTTVITNTGADLASSLAGKQYVTIEKTPITFIVPVIDQVNKQAVMLSHYPNGVSEYVDYIDYRWYRNGELVAEGVDNFREPSALNGCYHIEVPVDATKSQWVPSNEICFQNGVFVGIDAIDEYNFSFSVVPNPVTKGSMMTVSTQLSEQQLQGASLMVYDLKGHIFTTMPMSQQSVTLTAEQTPGIYVIQITTRTGEKYIQKVVVR